MTADRLEQLNEHLIKGDYALLSDDTQGFPGDLVLDFPAGSEQPYTALVMLESLAIPGFTCSPGGKPFPALRITAPQ